MKTWEKVVLISVSVAFLITMVALAVIFPTPPPSMERSFRTILSLMAAAFGAIIPGFIEVKFRSWLRAGGGMAVFVLVYFANPAGLVTTPESPLAPLIRSLSSLQSTAAGMSDGPPNAVERLRVEARKIGEDIEARKHLDRPQYRLDQARYAALAWLIAGDASWSESEQLEMADRSLEKSALAIDLLKEITASDSALAETLRRLGYMDKIYHLQLDAMVLKMNAGWHDHLGALDETMGKMSETYRRDWVGDDFLATAKKRYEAIQSLKKDNR